MRSALTAAALVLTGCVASRPVVREEEPLLVGPGARAAVVAQARELVGHRVVVVHGRRYGDDCTGLVRAAYAAAGVELMSEGLPQDNGVTAIWRFALKHGRPFTGGRPVAGDLVFFRDTYDLNRDGVLSDGLTHIGVVDEVLPDGTAVLIHRTGRGVVRSRLSLAQPDLPGANDWLRATSKLGPSRLTGQLFTSYATLLPVESLATR